MQQGTDTQTWLLDLCGNPLPLWDEGVWKGAEPWHTVWDPIKTQLQNSDAFIFVVPEWHGMVPSALKNLFQLCSTQELGHKPALIVAISSARGGSYPVSELRMSSYKNNRILYIPEHLIVRDVESMLNPGAPKGEDDTYIRQRLGYCLAVLKQYANALREVRLSGVIDHKTYPNGM
ncbi:MAG: NAD(P)H-dependent oxidoreductase [Proteobacteria bacterium]|nr:NAD(P)H-dependent oxidoreductase [Pseudomonadota bacterium]